MIIRREAELKLYQVRRGQFVYYHNELYKVYAIKPFFRKSIHIYRLKDMQQMITNAREIHLYRPKHMDTFLFYGNRYTLDENTIPKQGDYILINKPAPEFLDYYALHAIEEVDKVENGNVVTTRYNGVRHGEYVVLVPGKRENNRDITYFDKRLVTDTQVKADESPEILHHEQPSDPVVGDIYYDTEMNGKTMVVATKEAEVVLGDGERLQMSELHNENRYTLISASGR